MGARLKAACGFLGVVCLMAVARPVGAAEAALDMTATINGRDLTKINANKPLRLNPDKPTTVKLLVENRGQNPIFVRSVRLDSKVISLTFFAYETRVDLRVAPGERGEREFVLDLIDLGDQATGLLPSRLALLDQERDLIVSESFEADVRGSIGSTYAVFGLLVAMITGVLLAAAFVRLAAHRLSANRWRRAIRFGVPGLGIGLTLSFTLSAFRFLVPSAAKWAALVVVSGAIMFVVGYLTPTPYVESDGEMDDEYGDSIFLDDPSMVENLIARAVQDRVASSPGSTTQRREGLPSPPAP